MEQFKQVQRIKAARQYLDKEFDENAKPSLKEFIKIPNLSPLFDPDWDSNQFQMKAAQHLVNWVQEQKIPNLSSEIIKYPNRTPLLLVKYKSAKKQGEVSNILMYGHLDKQPHGQGWRQNFGPLDANEENGKLYGRGGADDGYAIYAAILAIKGCLARGQQCDNVTIIIQGEEESLGVDLPFYLEEQRSKFLQPDLIICLDSGIGNFEQLWVTTTLRGILNFTMNVQILQEGIHSGEGGGVLPDSFRIARLLIDRLEDAKTGKMIDLFEVDIPNFYKQQMIQEASIVGDISKSNESSHMPGLENMAFSLKDSDMKYQLLENQCWKPALAVTGASGLPDPQIAGNVLRPKTSLKISIRLPPTLKCKDIIPQIEKILTTNTPYNAKVTITDYDTGDGFQTPIIPQYLQGIYQKNGMGVFGKYPVYHGCGGSIPFMGDLGKIFPKAQFLVTGLDHVTSNAHGPNQNLDIEYCKKLIATISLIMGDISKINIAA